MTPIVSIIIPTFNSEQTVQRTLNSITNQTYQNWEAWVVDGCSIDNTIDAIKNYITTDKRIKYISEPDKGIYDAMNKGVQLAKGEWLYFLGSDDYLYQNNVLENVFTTDLTGYHMVYGGFRKKYIANPVLSVKSLLLPDFCHQSIFYHKSVFKMVGMYSIRYPVNSDVDFNLRLVTNTEIRRKHINEIVCCSTPGGTSTYCTDKKFAYEVVNCCRKHLKESWDDELVFPFVKVYSFMHLKYFNFLTGLWWLYRSGDLIKHIGDIGYCIKVRIGIVTENVKIV